MKLIHKSSSDWFNKVESDINKYKLEKIVENFKNKDYYDGFANFTDKNVLIREPKILKLSSTDLKILTKETDILRSNYRYLTVGKSSWSSDSYLQFFVLGFCGQIYIFGKFVRIYEENRAEFRYDTEYVREIILGQDLKQYLVKYLKTTGKNRLQEIDKKYSALETEFERTKQSKFLNSLFVKLDTPCFLLTNESFITTWPNLKALNFGSIMSGGECFQEIEKFVGTVLVKDVKPEVVVDDKVKILSHGFDVKTSFRNV